MRRNDFSSISIPRKMTHQEKKIQFLMSGGYPCLGFFSLRVIQSKNSNNNNYNQTPLIRALRGPKIMSVLKGLFHGSQANFV